MITAEQAYSQAVLGAVFCKKINTEIKRAADRGDLYFKLPYSDLPENKDLNDILKAFHIMGYKFMDGTSGEHIVLDFSFQWMDLQTEDS